MQRFRTIRACVLAIAMACLAADPLFAQHAAQVTDTGGPYDSEPTFVEAGQVSSQFPVHRDLRFG